MFATTNVPVVLRKITLALEDDDDDGRQRICKTTFRIPLLTFERANQVQDVKILWCCFTRDGLPRWEVDDVKFAPPEGHYTVTLRPAPDIDDPTAVLLLATIETKAH